MLDIITKRATLIIIRVFKVEKAILLLSYFVILWMPLDY